MSVPGPYGKTTYNPATKRDCRRELNHMAPAAAHAYLGDTLVDIITAVNAGYADANNVAGTRVQIAALIADNASLRTQLTALLADVTAIRTKFVATLGKLDADAGVTDTNYTALETPAALTAVAPAAATAVAASAPTVALVTALGFKTGPA